MAYDEIHIMMGGGALQGLSERVMFVSIRSRMRRFAQPNHTVKKVLNIHVTGVWGWLLSISHGGTGVIILVGDSSCFLCNV